MLFFNVNDGIAVGEAMSQFSKEFGDIQRSIKLPLESPLAAGGVAAKPENVEQLLQLLSLRKLAKAFSEGTPQEDALKLVLDDEADVSHNFGELRPLFELFSVTLEDVEVRAGEIGLIPVKLNLTEAFGAQDQAAEATWF